MRPRLNHDEMATIRNVISRRAKRAHEWKSKRWREVGASASYFALAVVVLAITPYAREVRALQGPWDEHRVAKPVTLGEIDLLMTEAAIDSRMYVNRSLAFVLALFLLGLGIHSLVVTLARWNRDREDAVFVKIVRFLTEEPAEPS